MDERSKKEEDIYLGVYHPYPKEAPKSWRMARMQQLRKEVLLKRQQKEKSKMNWLKDRVKEMSSWSGASLVVLGGLIILGGPFVNILAWAAVVWGIISICKKD